ncbi:MFS transporter [Pseudoroseicyclus tamaricis]|uniref:MFS transporter n=1 Tax=Pseudoroseicyclus tamaricis TaxID=2705421 RepID=A0A6B2JGE5_9RHOB|nr:MFS transporter [Pseudoroseicyclus tamaricis]NDV00251.1 MFS transporter [Pseudoroseicyclus tamaricis]
MDGEEPPAEPAVQSDFDKLRRIPWFYSQVVLTSTAVLCTVTAPLTLFAAEMGLGEGQIGVLGGIMPFLQVAGLLALPVIGRFGSRRVAASALTARYGFLCLFFLTPFFLGDVDVVFAILLVAMTGFALCRATAEAALIPWSQEFIPRAIRGRVAGRNALIYLPVALVVSWLIRWWLDGQTGLWRFYPVFAAGILCGIAGSLSLLGLRGGAPAARGRRAGPRLRALAEPLGDRNFLVFLAASGTQYLILAALNLFLLLFFRDLGMRSGELVFLSALTPVGAALGTLAAGWLVDRYGTRPVFLTLIGGQILLFLALPFMTAEMGGLAVLVAVAFFFFGLFAQTAMAIGGVYMLNVVPPASKEAFTTLHYITVGLVGGAATVFAGMLLARLSLAPLTLFGHAFAPFTVLFALAAMLSLVAAAAFYALREEGGLSVRDFFANFSTGSPVRALVGIQRIAGPTSEDRRRELAYGLGALRSPLAKRELIEALSDPSFDVRHEAVQSLGHLAPHEDVVAALSEVLGYDGLVELQYAAIASLGRLKARGAAAQVAAFLGSDNPLLRARALRALGEMGAVEALPGLRAALAEDPHLDCRLAAVSALGKLRDEESLGGQVEIYCEQVADEHAMAEPRSKVVLLALAKIIGVEESFARDWLSEQKAPGQVPPDLMLRLARMLRRQNEAQLLKRAAGRYRAEAPGEAWMAALTLRPLISGSGHPDAGKVRELIDGVAGIKAPHPALLILVLLGARRVLRK